jgi:hypothetical protein
MAKKKQKPFLSYQGIEIYETHKGRQALTHWYAIEPGKGEGDFKAFHISRLPKTYRSDLQVEYPFDQQFDFMNRPWELAEFRRFEEALQIEKDTHKIALQRAIDDGYNFRSAIRGNYAQPLRRLARYIRMKFAKEHVRD